MKKSKTLYHITIDGPKKCDAEINDCPYKKAGGIHYEDLNEAQRVYEEKMSSKNLATNKKQKQNKKTVEINHSAEYKEKLYYSLMEKGSDRIPKEILTQLYGKLLQRPREALMAIPTGSMLYNSQIPGRPVHDYDFMVLEEPGSKKITQTQQGELDLSIIPIDKSLSVARRSSSISEAIYAMRDDKENIFYNKDNNWSSYMDNIRIPEKQYFDLLDDVMRSHRQRFYEPATQDDKNNFHNFKHVVCWSLYSKRWGTEDKPFHTRLTDEERKLFLKAIETGRVSAIYE